MNLIPNKRFLRFNDWWHFKVAHLLGFAYFVIFLADLSLLESSKILGIYLVGVFGIAATGYIINDYYDREIDLKAGKSNSLSIYKGVHVAIIIVLLQVIALVPWLLLEVTVHIWILISLQYIMYFLYSYPLTRWKEKGLYGVLADSLYGHAIPALVTILALPQSVMSPIHSDVIFIATLFFWQVFKGARNIILHQLVDRKIDEALQVKTFAVQRKGLYALNLVNRVILPVEILLLISITWLISLQIESYYVGLVVFAVWTFFKFSGWRLFTIPHRQLKFKFLFFLNDYYEDWMPVIFLFFLIQKDLDFIFLLVAHLILFIKAILKLLSDIVLIIKNTFSREKCGDLG